MPPQFPLPGPVPNGGGPPSPLEFGKETTGLLSSMGFLAARKPIASTLVKELIERAETIRDLDPRLGGRMSHILSIAKGESEGIRVGENE